MATRFKTLFKRKSATLSPKKETSGSDTLSASSSISLGSSLFTTTRLLAVTGSNRKHSSNESRLQKSARLFISAPNEGMEEELKELNNRYFPLLKSYCDKNGVVFCAVDLRWNATDKAVEDGQIINISLQEIDRCDIFVGLHAQRYGWHVNEKSMLLTPSFTKASENYPWVEEFSDRSITEVEFRHAHLNDPGVLPSFFFFREKAYDDKKAAELEATDKAAAEMYKTESDKAASNLLYLKRAVKESNPTGFYDNYPTPEEGAKLVYTELRSHLERMFSKGDKGDNLTPEIADHVRFLRHYALPVESLIGAEKIFAKIDEFVEKSTEEAPLLLSGDSGIGKTTFLASWIMNRMIKKPNELVLFHFVGASPQSTSHRDALFRFVSYLRSELNPQGPKPSTKVAELVRQFRALLFMSHEKGIPITICINNLNRISTTTTLGWLPKHFPPKIRLVFTVDSNGPQTGIVEALEEYKCSKLQLEPFNNVTKEEFAKQVLRQKGKELSTAQLETVTLHKACTNPLFLRTLLNEICSHGDFFTLDKKIKNYLEASDVTQLCEKILERLEEEFNDYVDQEKIPNLIKAIATSIYSSVQGLSDPDLITLLNIDSTTLSIVTCAMDAHLISRSGMFVFTNHQFREAVRRRYLPTPEDEKKARDVLIDYFAGQLKSKANVLRVSQELPALLWKQQQYPELIDVITHPLIFNFLLDFSPYDLITFWKDSGASHAVVKEKYAAILETLSGDDLLRTLFKLTAFLNLSSLAPVGSELLDSAQKLQESINPKSSIMVEILNQNAITLVDNGKYDQAISIHKENMETEAALLAEAKDEAEKAKIELLQANTMSNIGVAYFKKREFQEAEKYHKTCLEMYKRINGEMDISVADTLNNIAVLYFGQKIWKEAEKYLLESLKIYDEIFLGEPSSYVGGTLLNLAIVYRNQKDVDKAEPLYLKAIEHREKTVGKFHPDYAQTLNGMAVFLMNTKNRPERALPLFLESLQIYIKVFGENHLEQAFAHENIAICILNMLEKGLADPEATPDKCDEHQKEALRIFKENKATHQSFPNIYQRISEYHRLAGHFEKAYEWSELLTETFKGTNQIDDSDLKDSKRNKALLYLFQGKPSNAVAILKEEKYPPNVYSSFYQTTSTFYKNEEQLNIGLESLEIGLQQYPGDPIFLYNLGHCCSLLKMWQESKNYFQKLIEIEPNDVDALIGLGEAKKHLGEKDTSDLDKALKKLNSSDPRAERINALKKDK